MTTDDDAMPLFRAVMIFDWYDGPRAGVARVETERGNWWYFRTLATRFDPDDLDHVLYALSAIPVEGSALLESEFGDPRLGPLVWPGDPGEVSARVAEAAEADVSDPMYVGRVAGSDRRCELGNAHGSFALTGGAGR
ncbi:hypothetical protein ACFWXO_26580 [Kitasatospora sp. NPDC059088]|uniref:hypothetical protein n=1 Tax=Kitasatospora sp. NPDC059088 TaxID=3346722 RepID=UPI003688DF61